MTITYINPLAVDPVGAFAAKTNIAQTYTANETFQTVTVGSGVTGLSLQPRVGASHGAIYSGNVTPALNNYGFFTDSANTYINGGDATVLAVGGTPILGATSTGVAITGTLITNGSINAYSLNGGSSVTSLNIVSGNSLAGVGINLTNVNANMLTAGTNSAVSITQTYNQASGTAANTDLLINRTETAVGSGGQLLIDAQVGGVSKFKVDNIGTLRITGRADCNGGVATGGNINIIVGYSGAYLLNGHSIVSTVVPTISSGFGTTPSIVIANGTAAFQVNVGSGGTATSGILTMPPAATGWAVTCTNPLVAADLMVVIDPTSTTSVTISCKTISTNAMAAFPANIVLTFHAHGF